jgi:hypothetical protein
LVKEEDCSTSSSNDDDDDDDTDDEYDYEELLLEFKKLISKHIKLQKRHGDLLYSHKELIDSYALLESTHEVMVTKVKNTIDLSCANSCWSQAKPSCDEHVPVETCDDLIASENDELKRENELLRMELSRLKGKINVQPSQDNRENKVKKLKKDQPSHVPNCLKSTWIHLINMLIMPRSWRKRMSSALSAQPWDTSHPNVPTRRVTKQNSLEDKEVYLREGALLTKKKTTISVTVQKMKHRSKSVKPECPVW